MRINYFKAGGFWYVLLGGLHLAAALSRTANAEQEKTFETMQNTVVVLLGTHNILQFYEGFSLVMGVLFVGFGVQCMLVSSPAKANRLCSLLVTLVVGVLSMLYFHHLASGILLLALLCFMPSLFQKSQKNSLFKA